MRAVWFAVAVVAAAVALVTGCVDHGPGPEPRKVSAAFVREHLVAAPPADLQRFDTVLGGRVVYLGNTVDQPTLAPGAEVTITHYWKVLAPIGPAWRVFGLVRGAPGTADFMNLPATDMQFAHGPATWRAGDIIEDAQTFTLRADWKSRTARVLVGLIEVGRHGTLDRMAAVGAGVEDRAIVARELAIDLSRAPPPPGTVHVRRVPTTDAETAPPIAIDGVAGELAWQNAPLSPEFVTAEGSSDPVGRTTARMTWDDEHLYVFVSVADTDIYSPYTQPDDPLWKADCLELFIDADGNRRGYVELQVNPNNAVFDSWFAGPRGPAGDVTWSSGMRTAVVVRGTAAKAGDTDSGWDAEIAIPWAAVKGRDPAMAVRTPPAVGEKWRLNVVRVDKRSGSDAPQVASWNRISYGDFHGLDRLLTVVFADAGGAIAAAAER